MTPGQPAREPDLKKLFEVWVSSERKAHLIVFFHQNPGLIETVEGLARRLGISADVLRADLEDHISLGVLKQRKVGDKTVIMYDPVRRASIEQLIERLIKELEAQHGKE